MTQEEKRIKIADWLGIQDPWRECYWDGRCGDYFADQNAVHVALQKLTESQGIDLCEMLNEWGVIGDFDMLKCKPEMIAEALGLTLKLWE